MRGDTGLIAMGVLVLLVASAGCADLLEAEGELSFTASEATVSDDALAEAGYELVDVREHRLNRSITVGNQTRSLNVTNYVAGYRASGSDVPDGAADVRSVFGVLSTPKAEVLGQPVNPLGHLSREMLMRRAITRAQSIDNLQRERVTTVTMLDTETNLTVYSGTVSESGTTVDVTAYVARVGHGDDYVVAAGFHRADDSSKAEAFETLLGGITHETED